MFLMLTALAVASVSAAPSPDDVKTVVITANDTLKFSVTRIEGQPGQEIHLQLKNVGAMPKEVMGHNWILLKAGADVSAYAAAAVAAKSDNYQPRALADEVLASIPLLGPRQTAAVTFQATMPPAAIRFSVRSPAIFRPGCGDC